LTGKIAAHTLNKNCLIRRPDATRWRSGKAEWATLLEWFVSKKLVSACEEYVGSLYLEKSLYYWANPWKTIVAGAFEPQDTLNLVATGIIFSFKFLCELF
jgi:hypothetical protein